MNILLTQRRSKNRDPSNNPIALLDLSPYLRNIGHSLDSYFLDELPNNRKYDVVGLSSLTYGKNMVKDALYLRGKFKDTKIVVGGKGARCLDPIETQILKENNVEIWTRSGEEYFSGEEEIDYNNYPSWDMADLKKLHVKNEGLMSSRGCPYHCNFCYNTENKISFFPAPRTVDNLELLFKLGRDYVFFVDDIFTIKVEHMLDIYEECKRRNILIEGRNQFFTHINYINEESAKAMALFKPIAVEVGLESGDDNMLKIMGKSFTAEIAYEKLSILSRYVPIVGLFLIGFPTESVESLNNTVRFVSRIRGFLKDIWVSFYCPVPKTLGYELAQKNGIIINRGHGNTKINYIDRRLKEKDLSIYRNLIYNIFLRSKYRILKNKLHSFALTVLKTG